MRKTRHKNQRDYKRIGWIVAGLLLLLVLAAGAYRGMHREEAAVEPEFSAKRNIAHVMILGVDRREDDAGRSDTLMVASLDEENGKGSLLSIPRDTRVAIEGNGYDKINHAYAYGGYKLSRKSVESLLGMPINHYILVDTKAFERIIDAMGGVDIDVEKRMYYEDPWDDNGGLIIDLYPGEQHLDGERAIQYVRYRDGEGDIGRIGRQQKFMKAVLAQLISPQILPKLPDLVEKVSGAVETDMSLPELLEFAGNLKDVHDHGVTAQMVPGRPAYLKDISYWIPDIKALRELIAESLDVPVTEELLASAERAAEEYEKDLPEGIQIASATDSAVSGKSSKEAEREEDDTPMKPEEISVLVINSSGINGAGAEVARILQRKGFIISSVETGKTDSWEHTTITTSSRNTDVFYGMPFECIIMDGGSKNQAVVMIGRDYRR
ncbi:MAG: LCP family protein [Selenomonadaceae bacterium]|nr:LCP family protein [Selenomonadaceae bacterium]